MGEGRRGEVERKGSEEKIYSSIKTNNKKRKKLGGCRKQSRRK